MKAQIRAININATEYSRDVTISRWREKEPFEKKLEEYKSHTYHPTLASLKRVIRAQRLLVANGRRRRRDDACAQFRAHQDRKVENGHKEGLGE